MAEIKGQNTMNLSQIYVYNKETGEYVLTDLVIPINCVDDLPETLEDLKKNSASIEWLIK